MRLKKRFFRLYYRRNAAKTITGLVCTISDETVTKAGATFNTEGASDQLFVGITVVIDSVTYRVASITSDTEFELDKVFESASSTYSGVFTSPALADMLGSALITEVDSYWTEFSKVEIG